jgi:hypothetical protein
MEDWDGTDRRGGQRWKLKKEVSIGDLIAFCSAALAVVYAYTTLDKRVTVLEAAAITVKDSVRDRDADQVRYQARIEESLRTLSNKLDRIILERNR